MRDANKAIVLTTLLVALAAVAPCAGQSPYRSEDPSADDFPKIGFRFGGLTGVERSALRPNFQLPLRALFEADSVRQLASAAVVQPLPDPNRPFLPTAAVESSAGDPFGDEGATPNRDALGALGELFAQEAELLRASGKTIPTVRPESTDSSTGYLPPEEEEPAAEPEADEDPFSSSDEDEDDPFGF